MFVNNAESKRSTLNGVFEQKKIETNERRNSRNPCRDHVMPFNCHNLPSDQPDQL